MTIRRPTSAGCARRCSSDLDVARDESRVSEAASDFNYLMYGMNFGVLDPHRSSDITRRCSDSGRPADCSDPSSRSTRRATRSIERNFLYSELYVYPSNPQIAPFINLAGNPQALIDAVDNALLYGRMSQNLEERDRQFARGNAGQQPARDRSHLPDSDVGRIPGATLTDLQ